jgi:soluble lytic murein transglycosylase
MRPVWQVAWLLLATACTGSFTGPGRGPSTTVAEREPLVRGLVALEKGEGRVAAPKFAQAARRHPPLEDYALYFRARALAASGRPGEAAATLSRLLETHPDSVWAGPAHLRAAVLARGRGDPESARGELIAARAALPAGAPTWIRATLLLAELDEAPDPAEAAVLAGEVRRRAPSGLAARRARRLTARLRARDPDVVPWDVADEAQMSLREGATARAYALAARAAEGGPLRDKALWVRAQAEWTLGQRDDAYATCRLLADSGDAPLAARALFQAARWRWNADRDDEAAALFSEIGRRFPDSPEAADSLYALGRIYQEEGARDHARYATAAVAYERLATRFPQHELAPEARWRAAWVRWLAEDFAAAERGFARLARRGDPAERAAAEYWRARALEHLGRAADARAGYEHLTERHPLSYYAQLADDRLGSSAPPAAPPADVPPPSFPEGLVGAHAERARLLAALGLRRFAREELDALEGTDPPPRSLLEAYRAIGALDRAVRLARAHHPARSLAPLGAFGPYLYPLGYWPLVRAKGTAHGVDPLLIAALIRQESLFDPDAVSPADARGLMQLLPSTAVRLRPELRNEPGALDATLHDPAANIDLGVTLLSRLLGRHDGSTMKALAAYNAGDDAVAKWERRYAGREPDEFVELISYRETRDYVKAVLGNYRIYRTLYATGPVSSASPTDRGSPPKAPFDMMATTSPGRADATR